MSELLQGVLILSIICLWAAVLVLARVVYTLVKIAVVQSNSLLLSSKLFETHSEMFNLIAKQLQDDTLSQYLEKINTDEETQH